MTTAHDTLVLPAPAKLNLFLHVTGRRPDGYHTLQTLFTLLDHGDTLILRRADALQLDAPDVPGPVEDNLVWRAARLLQEALNVGVDGIIGPITMGAAKGADPRELVCEIGARRMVLYGSLAHFRTFGLGWSRRLMGTVVGAVG